MDLPKIDLASLPGLETAQGLFGSATQLGATYEDSVVSVMVYVYDTGSMAILA
ncbi:hypothetical protein ACI5KX_11560 [Erythrobacter sp. GH1-10]|uniref:hypothetical protein n=1 Tax=Erythrobacter sp. GH1-10 TaxID=3349334 RepID=UPI003877E994